MFVLKKIVTAFLFPPGIFVVIMLLVSCYLFLKRNFKDGIIVCTIGCGMWLSSISPASHLLFKSLEKDINHPDNPIGDVIILLSGGAGTGNDKMERIFGAARLQKKISVPIIIAGDNQIKSEKGRKPQFKDYLIEIGVPPNKIISERTSRDTMENAKNSIMIIRKAGYKSPILVTSAYHMKRALTAFETVGLEVLPYPVGFKHMQKMTYMWYEYLPNSYMNIMVGLKEFIGLAYYQIYIYFSK